RPERQVRQFAAGCFLALTGPSQGERDPIGRPRSWLLLRFAPVPRLALLPQSALFRPLGQGRPTRGCRPKRWADAPRSHAPLVHAASQLGCVFLVRLAAPSPLRRPDAVSSGSRCADAPDAVVNIVRPRPPSRYQWTDAPMLASHPPRRMSAPPLIKPVNR